MESDEIADKNAASMKLLARPDLSMFTDSTTINDFLNADQKALLKSSSPSAAFRSPPSSR